MTEKEKRYALEKFLTGFASLKSETVLMKLRLETLRDKLMSPTLTVLCSTGGEQNSTALKLYEKALAAEKALTAELCRLSDAYTQMERLLDRLSDPRARIAVYSRYVCCEPWLQIQHRLGCSDRQTRRIAYAGLDELARLCYPDIGKNAAVGNTATDNTDTDK